MLIPDHFNVTIDIGPIINDFVERFMDRLFFDLNEAFQRQSAARPNTLATDPAPPPD